MIYKNSQYPLLFLFAILTSGCILPCDTFADYQEPPREILIKFVDSVTGLPIVSQPAKPGYFPSSDVQVRVTQGAAPAESRWEASDTNTIYHMQWNNQIPEGSHTFQIQVGNQYNGTFTLTYEEEKDECYSALWLDQPNRQRKNADYSSRVNRVLL